jgi:hypothetical protein
MIQVVIDLHSFKKIFESIFEIKEFRMDLPQFVVHISDEDLIGTVLGFGFEFIGFQEELKSLVKVAVIEIHGSDMVRAEGDPVGVPGLLKKFSGFGEMSFGIGKIHGRLVECPDLDDDRCGLEEGA